MNLFYLILMTVLVVIYVLTLLRLKKSSNGLTPILGWMAGTGFFLIIPLAVITLNGGYKAPKSYDMNNWGDLILSNPDYLRPYIWVWLSVLLACAVVYFFGPRSNSENASSSTITIKALERAMFVMMALAVADWVAMIWLVGGIEAFLISHWYTRVEDLAEQFGTGFGLMDHANEANQILFAAAASLYTSLGIKNRNTKWGFTALIIVFLLSETVMSGNRIFLALYLLGFLVSCWVFNRKQILIATFLLSPLTVLILGAWAAIRHDLANVAESTTTYINDDSTGNRVVTGLLGATEGTDVILMMHVINDFGSRFDYLYGSTYGRVVTSLVPRSVYPARPKDFTSVAASLYEPGESTSLNATALGEAYANFGVFGFALFPAVTLIACRYTDRLGATGRSNSLTSALAFVMFIWLARVTFAESFLLFLGATFLIWIFRFEKKPKAQGQKPPIGFATIAQVHDVEP